MSEASRIDAFARFCKTMGWLTLLRGILMVILGAYALFQPGVTLVVFAQVFGIYLMFEGILAVIAGISGQTESRFWSTVRGVVLVLVGLFVACYPLLFAAVNAIVLVILLGVGLVISGFMEVYAAIRDRQEIQGEGWLILSGALSVVLGVLLCIKPLSGALVITQFLGAFAIIAGIALIVLSFRVRGIASRARG